MLEEVFVEGGTAKYGLLTLGVRAAANSKKQGILICLQEFARQGGQVIHRYITSPSFKRERNNSM